MQRVIFFFVMQKGFYIGFNMQKQKDNMNANINWEVI